MHSYLEEAWRRLASFAEFVDLLPSTGTDAMLALSKLVHSYEGTLPLDLARELLVAPPDIPTLESTDRWVTIEYPASLAELTGSYGTSIRVSDTLRWAVAGGHSAHADYHRNLAEALDSYPAPRPVPADRTPAHRRYLESWLQFVSVIEEGAISWDRRTASYVHLMARNALLVVERGGWAVDSVFHYPRDFLPAVSESGRQSQGFAFPTGALIRELFESADYVSEVEKKQLKMALMFYPDEDLEIKVDLGAADRFLICDPSVLYDELSKDELGPVMGSVHLDHFGPASQFSPKSDKFAFRLHFPVCDTGSEYDEDTCFLVSDAVNYMLQVARD